MKLLKKLGEEEDIGVEAIASAKSFVQKAIYNGEDTETYLETRLRLYKCSNRKYLAGIPPDEDSLTQAILRVHHQVFYWLRCHLPNTPRLQLQNFGWIIDGTTVVPRWFTGAQFPPTLKEVEQTAADGSPTTKRRRTDEDEDDIDEGEEDDYHAGDEYFFDDVNSDPEDDEMNYIYFDSDSDTMSECDSEYET